MQGLNESKVVTTRDIILKPTSTTNNKSSNAERSTNTPNRSWRSTGWTPLSYPSLALFQNRADAEPSIAMATIDTRTSDSSFPPQELEQLQLNPFFPLHRDVILATVRELLILDGALDSSTLEVKDADENADIKITIASSEQKSEEKEKGDKEEETMQNPVKIDVRDENTRGVETNIATTSIEPAQKQTLVVQAEAKNIYTNAGEIITDDSDKMPSVPVKTIKKRKRSGTSNTTSAVNGKVKRFRGKGKNNKIKKPTTKKKKMTEQKTSLDTGKILSTKGTGTAVRIGARTLTNNMKKRSKALTILRNDESRNRNIPSSAESLAEILLNSCKLVSQQSHDRPVSPPLTTTVMIDSDSDAGYNKCDTNGNENDQVNENENKNRIRKVSDATLNDQDDHLIENEDTIVNMRIEGESRRQDPPIISAHLAVVAINLTTKTKSVNIESAVKQFVHNQTHQFELVCHDHNHSNDQHQEPNRYHINESLSESSSSSFTEDENEMELDEEAMLLDLERTGGLPKLLDLSIIMETQLRQNALAMTKQLSRFIDDRALGEFLGYGYKSLLPMRKKDRVVELISDFMFDVSHAMFAWEQTENDIYGYENHSKRSNDSKNDDDICKALFDSRALRKIGGFEPTSLLHHALSIKRLRRMGESWASFVSTTTGKKMFAQHHNVRVKVHVAQMRRDKRMKKNIAMCSSFPPVPTTKLEDNEKTSRSRSCSLSSEDSTETKVLLNPVSDTTTIRSCVTPIIPSLIPITITRVVGKSWGILLAREGSMCVVMRVPPHNENQLQRGDLIVSLRNEKNECVNTPTCSHPESADIHVSPAWFKQAVGIFKESNTLHLEVRRAITSSSSHA